MKRHSQRAFAIAFITFLLGSYCYYQTDIELHLGLDSLFQVRGVRAPPPEVAIVAMDEKSEGQLGESFGDYPKWRKYHGKVIDELQRQGAALIVFDLNFIQPQPDVDPALAKSLLNAKNVLLTECVMQFYWKKQEYWSIQKSSGREQCSTSHSQLPAQPQTVPDNPEDTYFIELNRYPPETTLANAALDHSPFYLPEETTAPKIYESWAFIKQLNEAPTLPVITWVHYLQNTGALSIKTSQNKLSLWLAEQRKKCLSPLNERLASSTDVELRQNLPAPLVNLLCAEDEALYVDYYGPPNTIKTYSYSDIYQGKAAGLKGKVVFVGLKLSHITVGQTTDIFRTPFTNNETGKMFGVEIMATQFANLLEGRHISSPLPPITFLFVYGFFITCLLCMFPGILGIILGLLASAAYTVLAGWCFAKDGTWLPVAVPLLIQLPIAGLLTMYWSYRDLQTEIQRILDFVSRVFPDWLPIVSGMHGKLKLADHKTNYSFERDVNGLCLATDIEDYTKVAAQSSPHDLLELLKAYYKVLAQPVKDRKGFIADVAGDAMIAFWIIDAAPVPQQRLAATLAALDMQTAVSNFNIAHETSKLPTRIGIHEGEMALGELNAAGSVQYRAIGDTVNAASRIQGVNKYLGTQILASAVIAPCLGDIVYRSVGRFLLVGLSEPLELIEIFSNTRYLEVSKSDLLTHFAAGLRKFQQEHWQEAITVFRYILDNMGEDGPTRFYLKLAIKYQDNPPPRGTGGVICFENK